MKCKAQKTEYICKIKFRKINHFLKLLFLVILVFFQINFAENKVI